MMRTPAIPFIPTTGSSVGTPRRGVRGPLGERALPGHIQPSVTVRNSSNCRRTGTRGGSALILVLWITCLLSMMVASFAFDAQVEARITSYLRKRTKADYLAQSGLDVVRMLMAKSEVVKGAARSTAATVEATDDRWMETARKLSQGLVLRGLVESVGEGTITLDIVPEPARRNINVLLRDGMNDPENKQWEAVLDVGEVPVERWDGLIDGVLDWYDPDPDARNYGAETEDYYNTLEPPRKAKNGPLDTVEELLLVKGFNRAIVYGGVIRTTFDEGEEGVREGESAELGEETEEPIPIRGIGDLLTTYGDGKVNVNAASRRVLMTLPDVDDTVADAILDEREGDVTTESTEPKEDTSFKSPDDFMTRVPEAPPTVRDFITVDSKIFRITSVGTVGGVNRQVSCIVEFKDSNMTILRWMEQD